jgi:hypothetical protein
MPTNPIDLTGRVFGRLTARRLVRTDIQGAVWSCDCGGTVAKYAKELLRRQGLTAAGYQMSCGCHQGDVKRLTKSLTLSRR